MPVLAQGGGSMLFFSGDMVVSPPKGSGGASCVLRSQYMHNEEVVWRVRVLQQDGQPVTDKDITGMEVKISSGETFKMRYGGHPHSKPVDFFWTAGWRIPDDYPAGSLTYTVTATRADGSTESWEPFNVAPSQLTVLEGKVEGTE
jgi:hypothetical protein